ncbi:hypothetical protein [Marinoscillum furvescens]|uniref:Glycosyl hydrolase family 43 n=1 Tax=Marinoscillum furvescens DSM 4134 TaxID=1122208 RepID=A0A3D9L9R5_MARFU|nr:hypothetical protein [Marinoscillum furvescens]REE01993.1 hypothetical protein C7460_10211 [Marinoscillum furvescens DSM 4134]
MKRYWIQKMVLAVGVMACSTPAVGQDWVIATQTEWQEQAANTTNLTFENGAAVPTARKATYTSRLKRFATKRAASEIVVEQSPVWQNWQPVANIGPSNLGDAPIMLRTKAGDYWMFGRYQFPKGKKKEDFEGKPVTLEGYDVPLKTTPFPEQYDAPGGLNPSLGGYHAWQSKDLKTWVHHGPVSEYASRWMTSAEYVDGKFYLYYDFPNDQDPHLYIDEDLTDGKPGENIGMAFWDPSHGSDCAIIRDMQGKFHLILEDWSPIDASKNGWDSPLAMHAVGTKGYGDFEILDPPVDERTTPTGEFAEYPHPHWHAEAPDRFPAREAKEDVPQHRIKKGQKRAFGKYEIHEPAQHAFGDWAAISIGGQYYLFGDIDPAEGHGNKDMSVAWFTSSDINEPFTFCGNIGQGHPDPDIMFAEGQFYLATQQSLDFVSPGPWVENVDIRVGIDTDNDGLADYWSAWKPVKESYDYVEGFSKQVAKTPARLDLSNLPEGYGFQFEVMITDATENDSKPIIEKITLSF